MRLSIDDLRRKTVVDSAGIAIGEVDDFFLDSQSRQLDTLRVKLRRELAEQAGARSTFFHKAMAEVPMQLVQSIGDAVLLQVRFEELQRAPDEVAAGPAP